jgi:hypothetical protein
VLAAVASQHSAAMNADDAPVTDGKAQLPATVAVPRSRQPVPVHGPDEAGPAADDRPLPSTGHRVWPHWLMIGLLVAVSAGVTALFVVTLVTDLLERHWAQALDSTREAVPAAVGWGALFMILFIGGTRVTRRSPADTDDVAATELRDAATQLRAAAEDDAVRQAEECVQSLTARLRMLAAGADADAGCFGPDRSQRPDRPRPDRLRPDRLRPDLRGADPQGSESPHPESQQPESPPPRSAQSLRPGSPSGSPAPRSPQAQSLRPGSPSGSPAPRSPQAESPKQDRSLARQVAETSARLERARQWLVSAQAALAATRENAAPLTNQTGGRSDGPDGRGADGRGTWPGGRPHL